MMFHLLFSIVFLGYVSGDVLGGITKVKDNIPVPNAEDVPLVGDILKNTGFVWQFYKDENSERSVEILNFTTPIGILKGEYCYIYGEGSIIKSLLELVPWKKTVSDDEMDELIERCSTIFSANILKGSVIPKVLLDLPGGIFRRLFIFPGTRWCGAGNIARGYENLGIAIETDKCCREHDSCDDNIPAKTSKHGLDNKSPITKSNCNCDNKFYQCLKSDDSLIANSVGVMYFNILSMQCFTEEYPLKCISKNWLKLGKCTAYELDKSKPKEWQFVDPKTYEPGTKDENLTRMFSEY